MYSIFYVFLLSYLCLSLARSEWQFDQTDYDNWNQTCIEPVNTTIPKCRINHVHNSELKASCLENNVFRIRPNSSKPREEPYDLDNEYTLDDRPYADLQIECKALFPLDFDFEGVGVLSSLDFTAENYRDVRRFSYIQIRIKPVPESTGRFIFHSIQNPQIQTSFFLFAERGEPPYLISEGTKIVHAKKLNATTVVLPCVSSDLNVDVKLFEKVDNTTWLQHNVSESEGLVYDRKQGFIMNPPTPGEYRCFTGNNEPATSTDYVEVKLQSEEEQSLETRMAENIHIEIPTNTSAVCYSTGNHTNLKFINVNPKNPTESRLLLQCLLKGNEFCGKNARHRRREGRRNDLMPCPNNATSCLWISDVHTSGILYCSDSQGTGDEEESEAVTQEYIVGLDKVIYTNWTLAPFNALIKPTWTPNSTSTDLVTGVGYNIECQGVDELLTIETMMLRVKFSNGTQEGIEELGSGWAYFLAPEVEEFICTGNITGTESVVEWAIQINVNGDHHHMIGTHCESERNKCRTTQECIMISWICDGDRDCTDGFDEENCPTRPSYATTTTGESQCMHNQFQCANGNCILSSYKCDGDRDCSDNSDEMNCTFCHSDIYKCENSTTCLRGSRKCNNVRDCPSGEDESAEACMNVTCLSTQTKCSTGQCISISSLCDGVFDCFDKSDESLDHCSIHYPQFTSVDETRVVFTLNTYNELICGVNHSKSILLKPRIDWWRRGLNITDQKRIFDDRSGLRSSLRFHNISEEDAGEYVCMATNRLKSLRQVYHVTVQGILSTTTKPETTNVNILEGTSENADKGDTGTGGWIIAGFVILAIIITLALGAFVWRYISKRNRYNGSVRVKHSTNEGVVINGM